MNTIQREEMDVDILIIGGGTAGLSAAIHLKTLINKHNQRKDITYEQKLSPTIAILEKGYEIGSHSFSGAVLNLQALKELIPNYLEDSDGLNVLDCPVQQESLYYLLHRNVHLRIPFLPSFLKNHGHYIISISKLNRWLGKVAQKQGIDIFTSFAAVDAVYTKQGQEEWLTGIQIGDKGINKLGIEKANFEPGMILKSKITVFAEGSRGSLFKKVSQHFDLYQGRQPDVYEVGVKEIIQLKEKSNKIDKNSNKQPKAGQIMHFLGYPLIKSVGGAFLYVLPENRITLGIVGHLDTPDPLFDPHRELQKLKTQKMINKIINGGKVISYGGKTLAAGGWHSMPKLFHNGMLVLGDSASLVNTKHLKGLHLAMKSGILAAETVLEALIKNDFSTNTLKLYEEKINQSEIKQELYDVRNVHKALKHGIFRSLPNLAIQKITNGWNPSFTNTKYLTQDSDTTEHYLDIWGTDPFQNQNLNLPNHEGDIFFDKTSSVYLSGTLHEEDAPNHLIIKNKDICLKECYAKYLSPCCHFCPASVYEIIENKIKKQFQINFTNCIHCKTCDIKCPFENIVWTPPEGGGGPRYHDT